MEVFKCKGNGTKPTLADLDVVVAAATNQCTAAAALDSVQSVADAAGGMHLGGFLKECILKECILKDASDTDPGFGASLASEAPATDSEEEGGHHSSLAAMDLKAVAIAAAKAANSAAASAKILATSSAAAAAVFKALVLAEATALAAAADDASNGRVAIRQTLAMAEGFALSLRDAARKYHDLQDAIARLGAYHGKFLILAANAKTYTLRPPNNYLAYLDHDERVALFLWGSLRRGDPFVEVVGVLGRDLATDTEEEGEPLKDLTTDNSLFAAVDLKAVAMPAARLAKRAAESARILAAAASTATAVFEALVLAEAADFAAAEDNTWEWRVAVLKTIAMAKEFALDVRNASCKCQDFEDEVSRLGSYDGEFLLLADAIFGLCPEVFPRVVCEERERCISHFLWGDAAAVEEHVVEVLIPAAADVVEVSIPAAAEAIDEHVVEEVPRHKSDYAVARANFMIMHASRSSWLASEERKLSISRMSEGELRRRRWLRRDEEQVAAEHLDAILIPAADEEHVADEEQVADEEHVVEEVPWHKGEFAKEMAAYMDKYNDRPGWLASDVRLQCILRMPWSEIKRRRLEKYV